MQIGAVFDCDGTLVDSVDGWRSVEREFARMCGQELTPEDTEQLCTFTIDETGVFYYTKFGLGKSPQHVVDMIHDILEDYYTNVVELRPGVGEFLEGMAQAGVPMTVASSSPQRFLQPGIKRTGIFDYFSLVLSTDDVNAPKREPKIYLAAAEHMGTPVASTWGFEDSIYAVRTLVNAGFKCAGCYDRDDSATMEQLRDESHFLIESFDMVTAVQFLAQARV